MRATRPARNRRRNLAVAVLAGAAAVVPGLSPAAANEVPERVMSLNVCTDQLAMLLAAPGQLISVSELAADPGLSFHHARAAGFAKNRGLAEEVFLERPDLIVTGTYSLHNTTTLLTRLGFRVEAFDYGQTLGTVAPEIRRMGRLLGRSAAAESLATEFESSLAMVERSLCGAAPTAIAYDQNGIAMGSGTLVDSAMQAAGLRNIAAELGFAGMAPFPLELLVQHRPQIIVLSEPLADTPSLADQIAGHPAIRALGQSSTRITLPRGSASCGGPFIIEAIKALRAARETLVPCPPLPGPSG
ncbi:MAG: ABC transporter substrate-binding protein [Mesorhizobium sp.]|nr:ABC transporter substrate-binding protein [Mesorhizobium sp.]